jgi:hypothetical protein
MVRTHNLENNEVTDREMNDIEFAQWEADQVAETERLLAKAVKDAQREAVLTQLGITEEQARLLLS